MKQQETTTNKLVKTEQNNEQITTKNSKKLTKEPKTNLPLKIDKEFTKSYDESTKIDKRTHDELTEELAKNTIKQ
ncbi:hypothetical protein C2G38_2197653 [Gigaspora rosea]|uniref:Uncharacterized protein n=1 Tax=Gigaspora rosea TaxID=44941 RepID=A0A397UUN3_9GLOM|nr:hypothetical protein C2G38_2197653 [Gigaspora rosea]